MTEGKRKKGEDDRKKPNKQKNKVKFIDHQNNEALVRQTAAHL